MMKIVLQIRSFRCRKDISGFGQNEMLKIVESQSKMHFPLCSRLCLIEFLQTFTEFIIYIEILYILHTSNSFYNYRAILLTKIENLSK